MVSLFDQRPWLSVDESGDRDPEGVQYRVFLDVGEGKGRFLDGTFHIEMYKIERDQTGKIIRTLASDWNYPTTEFAAVRARILGEGYRIRLHWADKNLAGSEIELITRFKDEHGHEARSDTKRMRIPKYAY